MSFVALLATVGVYGLVAIIVRMDEFGYKLIALNGEDKSLSDSVGRTLVRALPVVIKSLAIIGTIALLLVSGGIFTHYIEPLHHIAPQLPSLVKDFLAGLSIGLLVVVVVKVFQKVFGRKKSHPK